MRKSVLLSLISIVILTVVSSTNAQSLLPSPTGSWTLTGAMSQARTGAAAVAMGDGSVLVTGGTDEKGVVSATAEIYSSGGTFKIVAPMNVPRTGHAAVWLDSAAYVLVTGGTTIGGAILNSAELYDPYANVWTLLPAPMVDARTGHPAAPLPNDSVLMSGGTNASGLVSSLEKFNFASQQFTFVDNLLTARKDHAAAALDNGSVLLVGGTDANGTLATTEIYDPVANTLTPGPNLLTPRAKATATTLLDGTVLIVGGTYPEGALANGKIAELQSAEIYDPGTGKINAAPTSLAHARSGHQAFLLPNNNRVLIVGGTYDGTDLATTELYTPWTGTFTPTGSMSVARSSATGAALFPMSDGQLLVAGGSDQASAELYGFATIKTDKADYVPGDALVLTGTGWQPGETVAVTIHETTGKVADQPLALKADPTGKIADSSVVIQPADWQLTFTVTAIGTASQAQTEFWDASINGMSVSPTTGYVTAGNSASFTVTLDSGDGFATESGNVTLNSVSPATSSITASQVPFSWTQVLWLPGSDTVTFNVNTTSATPANATYTLTIGNTETPSQTTTATLVVGSVPTLATSPTNQTTTYGGSATFTASANGYPTPTVQWQYSSNGSSWNNVSGATSATYTLTNAPIGDNGYQYRAVFTNGLGSVTSGAATLTVNPAQLTVTGITASNKTYDRTTTATISTSGATLSARLNGDSVTLHTSGATGAFSDKNVANGKTVQIAGLTITGSGASNYTLVQPTTTANITPKTLTVSGITANSKVYDATTTATLTTGSAALSGVISGDTVSVAGATGAFASKTVATGKAVTVSAVTLGGADGGNYTVTNPTGLTANITSAGLTVSGITASNKIYDGSTSATLVTGAAALVGVISGDTVTLSTSSASGVFSSKNVGTGIGVTVSGVSISGADSSNYSLTQPTGLTANITAKAVTASGLAVNQHVYDGTTAATLNFNSAVLSGVVSGDTSNVSLNQSGYTATFASKDVGTTVAVTVSNLALTGSAATNYTLTQPTGLTGAITARPITVTAAASTKTYDGGTTSTALPTITTGTLASGDSATWTESYDNKNAGTTHVMTPAGTVNDGNGGANYNVTKATIATGVINKLAITVTAAASTKSYDGGTSSSGIPTIAPALVGTDTASFTQSYASKNVGSNLTLTPTGSISDGNSGNNYNVTFANNTGSITARAITVTAVSTSKTYDGGTSSSGTPTIAPALVGTDTPNFSQSYASKNAGTNLTLIPTGSVFDGNSGNNYSPTFANNTNGVITGRTLVVSATGVNKLYDGSIAAAVTLSDNRLSGDTLTAGYTGATFDNKNVGTAKTINVVGITLSGTDAGNYTSNTTATATANISAATLTVTATGISKSYDGTTSAVVTLSDNRVANDQLTTTYSSASFADKNVGTAKPVTVSGISISGTDSGNYQLSATTANTTASINSVPLTIAADAKSKIYGTNDPALTYLITAGSLVSGDQITGSLTRVVGENVGSYAIQQSTLTAGSNYTIAYTPANLTVTPASASVTPNPASKVYGTSDPVFGGILSGFLPGDNVTAVYSRTPGETVAGGPYTIAATLSPAIVLPNYTITYNTANFTINKALATVTLGDLNQTYDGTPKAASASTLPSGLVIIPSYQSATYGPTATPPTDPGAYTVTATIADQNYNGMATDTLTINQLDAKLNLTLFSGMTDPSPYGNLVYFELAMAKVPCPTGQVQFNVDGNLASSVTLNGAACSAPVEFQTTTLQPGLHTVTAVYAGDTYYSAATSGTVTHTVIADTTAVTLATSGQSVNVGQPVTFTATVTPSTQNGAAQPPAGTVQFFDGDSQIGESQLSATSPYTANFTISTLIAGSHSISAKYVNLDGLYAGSSSAVSVDETVNKIVPTVNWPNPADIIYGTKLGSDQLNAKASYNGSEISGTFTYDPLPNTVLAVGTRNLSVKFTPDDTATYETQTATATINVTAATLTVKADDVTRLYATDNPTSFTYKVTGFVNDDTVESATSGQPKLSTTATLSSPVGSYDITVVADTFVAQNYTLVLASGQLAITAAPASVTPNAATKVYGTADPTLNGSLSGFLPDDGITATYTRAPGETVTGGPYTITATLNDPNNKLINYTVTSNTASFAISKATASVTPNAATKVYGTLDPTFTGSLSGFLAADDITATYTRTSGEAVGGLYTITATLNDANNKLTNYTVTINTANLTITKATASVTPVAASKVYGTVDPALTGTLNGFLPSDGVTATYTRTPGETVVGGPYAISATLSPAGVLSNYDITYSTANFTISQASVLVQVNNAERAYGAANPTFTGTLTGVTNGDSISASYATAATVLTAVGKYPITATLNDLGNKLSNYSVTNTSGTLTITAATLQVGMQPATKTYGTPNPTFTPTFSGFVNSDTTTVLNGTINYATSATNSSAAGNYPVTLSGLTAANYAISYIPGVLSVLPAVLTVTANNQSRNFGLANPALTYTVTGFVNGDTSAVVTGTALCTTTATTTSAIGTYPINCTQSTLQTTNNYTFAWKAGTFTVLGADLVEINVGTSGTPISGGTLQVIDTTTNQGNLNAGSSITAFYISTDGQTKGTYLGYRYVGALAPAAVSGPVTTTLTLPTNLMGGYYLMACADYASQVAEGNEANNCSAAGPFLVAPADLVESAASVVTSNPISGGSLQVSDTVTNQGIGNAPTSITAYYISIDGKTKGTYLGYRYVGALAPSGSSGPITTTLTLPTNLNGPYYLMACADYANQVVESSETNNCTASAQVSIAPADLTETAVSVLTSPSISGGSVQVSDTVSNVGAGNSGTSITAFYISTDGKTKGTYLGYRYVGALSPSGASGPVTTTLTLPTSLGGTYYLIACADYANQVAEANKANNCASSAPISITAADLSETSFTAPNSATSGGSVQVSDTVSNVGGGNAGSSITGFYLSNDGLTKGTYLGYRYVAALAPSGTSGPVTTTLTLPANSKGNYYLMACADYANQVVESSKTNNCAASGAIQVK